MPSADARSPSSLALRSSTTQCHGCSFPPPSEEASRFRRVCALRLRRCRRSPGGATCFRQRSRCSDSSRRAAVCSPSPLVRGGKGWGRSPMSKLMFAAIVLAALAITGHAAGAPSLTYTVTSGTPGDNGWYLSDVTVSIQFGPTTTDTTCPGVKTFHSSADTLDCTSSDGTPVGSTLHLQFKIDKDKPAVTGASPDRQPNASGWYNAPVTVTLAGTDGTSGIASCQQLTYNGGDSATASVSGTCRDVAGNVTHQYDSTPPTVKVALGRGPDANGWYNHPIAATASGSDSGSGLDGCSAGSYDGPASDSASLTGTCKDRAGNSASDSVSLKYDATPPTVSQVTAAPGNGTVTLHWTISPDSSVTVTRSAAKKGSADTTVYHGTGETFTDTKLTNGLRYRYSISVVDQAGNKAEAGATATPLALSVPRQGTRLTKPPNLTWSKVVGASYYNVQLFQGGKKKIGRAHV